jgi:hypothetical protein
LVTVISGGVFDLLDPVLERHSFDDLGAMVDAKPSDDRCCPAGIAHGGVASEAKEQGPHPFGSGFPVHQRGLGVIPKGTQS